MDSIKKLGAVISAHYEKFILSFILLVLLGAAAFLPYRVSQNREMIRQTLDETRVTKKPYQSVDAAVYEDVAKREKAPVKLSLSGEHNLFNPVLWKRSPNGGLIKIVKGDEDGPGGLIVSAIRPLHLIIEFEGVQTNGENLRYRFNVVDESKSGRGKAGRPLFAALNAGNKNDPFKVTKVNGPADNPTSIEIVFADSTETATISKEQPLKRVAGYEADLAHEKLSTRFSNQRPKQGPGIKLGSQTYKIVAINGDEVSVESSTSNKRWTIRRKGTP